MNRVRWGILGVAHINERLVPAFAKAHNADLRGIASRSLEKAQAAAKAAHIPLAFGSYEALLDDPNIDAVYIPLPNSMHTEWTRKAADRGKHVLCEKPLTATADEAAQLVEYCRAKKVYLMDGFMWPHHPRTSLLEMALRNETIGSAIGKVRRVAGAFTFKMEALDPKNIRLQPEMGGGSLLDVGCYPVYGIRWAFGEEPVRVWASARYEYGVDVEMTGVLWFADGRMASFDCGFVHPFRQWLEITGETGVANVQDMWQPSPDAKFEVRRQGSHDPAVYYAQANDQIVCMIEDFGKCVLEGSRVTWWADEAVKTLRVLDALALSAKEKREIELHAAG